MTVFANGLEIACKAQGNKVIANFPDVCFTPPENPATPPGVPVPYPSFGFDSDTDSGTSTVKISGKTITQKNKSYYTKTSGTEAGCAAKKGVITSKNTGKEYAVMWSSNVKADGEPVNRMSDLSTNNHASPPGNTVPHPKVAAADLAEGEDPNCLVGEYDAIQAKCARATPPGEAHHIVPDKCFRTGTRADAGDASKRIKNAPSLSKGVCICIGEAAHKNIHNAERDSLNKLGKAGSEGLTGAAFETKKASLKASGDWGTAGVAPIHRECKKSLNTIKGADGAAPTGECIKKAQAAVDKQLAKFDAGQTGRTSNSLPGEAAIGKMKP